MVQTKLLSGASADVSRPVPCPTPTCSLAPQVSDVIMVAPKTQRSRKAGPAFTPIGTILSYSYSPNICCASLLSERMPSFHRFLPRRAGAFKRVRGMPWVRSRMSRSAITVEHTFGIDIMHASTLTHKVCSKMYHEGGREGSDARARMLLSLALVSGTYADRATQVPEATPARRQDQLYQQKQR